MLNPKVSIIILTYNAPKYVKHTLYTLKKTDYPNYEVIVFDNGSTNKNRKKLNCYKRKKLIDKLIFSDKNLMFIKGNNEAFLHCDATSNYVILLNSDIEIRNKNWLKGMLSVHKTGITATSRCDVIDNRPDGWCYMVDYFLFKNMGGLDDKKFDVYFSCADLASKVLRAGYKVQTIELYENFIYHFGNASGKFNSDLSHDKKINSKMVNSWFPQPCDLIERIEMDKTGKIFSNWVFHFYDTVRKKKHRK